MISKNLSVPLSYMNNYDDGKISWDVQIPDYVNTDAISLDLINLKRVTRLAGLRRMEINSGHYIDEKNALANYQDYDDSVSNIIIYEDDLEDDAGFISSEYRWDYGEITVNNTQLYADVLKNTQEDESIDNPSIWADHLNTTLKNSLLEASKVQLTEGISTLGKINALSVFAIGMTIGLVAGSPEAIIPSVLGMSLINQTSSAIYHQNACNKSRERRFSILPNYQLDRLLIIKAILKYRDLVKPNDLIEQEN
jgi:hypothetical protein